MSHPAFSFTNGPPRECFYQKKSVKKRMFSVGLRQWPIEQIRKFYVVFTIQFKNMKSIQKYRLFKKSSKDQSEYYVSKTKRFGFLSKIKWAKQFFENFCLRPNRPPSIPDMIVSLFSHKYYPCA